MGGLQIAKAKVNASKMAFALQLLFGLGAGISFGTQLVSYFTTYNGTVFRKLFLLLAMLGSLYLAVRGAKGLTLLSRFERIRSVLSKTACETLEILADRTRIPQRDLIPALRKILNRGYLKNVHLDMGRGMLLVVGPHFKPRPAEPDVKKGIDYIAVHHPSVAPIYSIAAVWLVYMILFPLYRWYDFLFAGIASIMVYLGVRRWAPDRIVYEKRPLPPPVKPVTIQTGNPELDEVLTTASKAMSEMTVVNQTLTNPQIHEKVQEILRISSQIFDFVKKHPENLRAIRQFMSYYLPTTIKLLRSYAEFTRQPEKGGHIVESMDKIEDMMDTIVQACKKQLDDLYRDKAMDISLDIEVMQSLLREQGLVQEENE